MRYFIAILCLASVASMQVSVCRVAFSQDKQVDKISSEADLIAILAGNAPASDKALACKRLAIYGSGAAATELAKLLKDEQLSSWSRIALEAIPGKEADEALRNASESLSGRLLVGALNSIGVRRDAGSVEMLIKQLANQDADVASSAAVALGKIGGSSASDALRKSMAAAPAAVRSAIAEGCELCAERFLAEGNAAVAIEIYDEVRKAELPRQRIVEATRGAILAKKKDGIPLLLEQLRSSDKAMFQVGLWLARELPGNEVVDALVTELKTASPERAALIVYALSDRKGSLDLPMIIKLASSGPREVRIAAMAAISRIGDTSCVAPLLKIATEKDSDLLLPAKAALAGIQDENADKEIIGKLPGATGDMQQLLIEVIGRRRIEATSELVKAIDSPNKAIRAAALEALGSTVPQNQLSILVRQMVAPKNADDAAGARQALLTAAIRMPDREACATELATAMKGTSMATKTTLLEILAAVGGTNALQAVGTAAKDPDPQLKDVGSRLLGEWLTIDAAPVCLELATTGPADKFQLRAIKGYIRIVKQLAMPEKDRVAMCTKALEAAKQPAEQKAVVAVLAIHPSLGTLKLALQAMKNPDLKTEATQAALKIAEKLGDKKEVLELMSKAGLAKP